MRKRGRRAARLQRKRKWWKTSKCHLILGARCTTARLFLFFVYISAPSRLRVELTVVVPVSLFRTPFSSPTVYSGQHYETEQRSGKVGSAICTGGATSRPAVAARSYGRPLSALAQPAPPGVATNRCGLKPLNFEK